MVFAAFVGFILGLRSIELPLAIVVLVAALFAKAYVDVRYERVPLFAVVSPYVLYCRNLEHAGERTDFAWISYVMQLFVFGGIAGGVIYAIVMYFKS